MMDWSGVFLTEAKGVDLSLAGVGYAVFSAAMLIGRLIGDKVVQKIRRTARCYFWWNSSKYRIYNFYCF